MQLADRVLVMSKRPATIQQEVLIDLPCPSDLDAPGYLAARDRIFAIMGMDAHGGGAGEARRTTHPRSSARIE